jgi:hypothetical protein
VNWYVSAPAFNAIVTGTVDRCGDALGAARRCASMTVATMSIPQQTHGMIRNGPPPKLDTKFESPLQRAVLW